MNWAARIGIGVLCLFGFGACVNAVTPDTPRASRTATPAGSQQQAAPAGPAEPVTPAFPGAQPGDVATTPGGSVTFEGVTITGGPLAPGSDTFGATLCTTVTYANGSGEQVSYGVFDWSMQNPSGAIVNLTFFGGDDSHLGSGDLAPGGSTQGTVCFEDENASGGDYLLLYDPPSFLTQERAAWVNPR